MRTMTFGAWLACVGLGAAMVSGCDPGPIVTQDSEVGEDAYRKHAVGWLRWVMEQPWSTGPVPDATGAACGQEQSGKVWYLAGTTGGPVERDCDIPKNKFLFFPLENFWVIPQPASVDTEEERANYITIFTDYFENAWRPAACGLTLTLDGEELVGDTEALDEALWVSVLDPFEVELNDDNWNGTPGGTRPFALHAGHFALLFPLEPGDHELEFSATICDGEDVYFETSALYHLHVAE